MTDLPIYSIIKIGQNTEKSPGDLRRLAVTQTPIEDHQLTLVRKTLKGIIMMMIIIVIGKGTGRVENRKTNRDRPNYSIVKIGQNTEKSPGDLRRLAVTQNPVEEKLSNEL